MDGGILVISSPDGPMAQTREHILLSKQVPDAALRRAPPRSAAGPRRLDRAPPTGAGGRAQAGLLHEQGEVLGVHAAFRLRGKTGD